MSEDNDPRDCDETLESEEGDVEPYLEELGSSRELLGRLRELEAENSALALANESQREAYERCLDEVANHVVQALLNQKDLREECIKLKMRVFDLERQNRTLTEFFHQKLHSQFSTGQQLPSELHTEHNPELLPKGPDKSAAVQSEGQAKTNGDCTPNGTADTRAPSASMEALSPFFKKKAHILEVLRRLEETDPLKFHPYPGLPAYYDFSQALIPTESALVPGVVPTHQHKGPQSHCRHSCSDSDIHEYANGDRTLPEDHGLEYEGCQSCLMLSQKSLAGVLKCNHGHVTSHPSRPDDFSCGSWPEVQGASAQSTDSQATVPASEKTDPASRAEKPDDVPQLMSTNPYLYSGLKDATHAGVAHQETSLAATSAEARNVDLSGEGAEEQPNFTHTVPREETQSEASNPAENVNLEHFHDLNAAQVVGTEQCYFEVAAETSVKSSLLANTPNAPIPKVPDGSTIEYCERESREQICSELYYSPNEASRSKKVAADSYPPPPSPEKNSMVQQPPHEKAKLVLSPTSFSEVKPSPISSPSRLLRFLKIPSIGERAQAANPLRLSPQLTRSSKIPCRNNYEVHHSPVLARKATTTEREKQPQSSKVDSYPSAHSAPTSPPKPEDDLLPIAREINFSGSSVPKACHSAKSAPSSQPQRGFQKVPHYENVCDVPTSCHLDCSSQCFEGTNIPHFLPYPQNETCVDKQPKIQEKKIVSPSFKQHNVSSTAEQPCDFSPPDLETQTEGTVWCDLHDHHSLSASSASQRAQSSCSHPSISDRHEKVSESSSRTSEAVVLQDGAQRGDLASIPKKTVAVKPPSESSHHLFKERLAALGKLKTTEDLIVTQPADKKDAQCNAGKVVSPSIGEKSKTAERQSDRGVPEHKLPKHTDSLDGKPYPKPGSLATKSPAPCPSYEPGSKSLTTSSVIPKAELETFGSKIYVAKAEGPKIKVNLPSSSPDPPQVLRNYMKCSSTPNPPYSSRTAPSPQNSPTKVPSKSPSKAPQAASNPRPTKPSQDDRVSQKPSPRSEDKSKFTGSKKKSPACMESAPPGPIKSAEAMDDRRPFVSAPQSAIEQKVMKGIEENMLKLQEQDRGHAAEVKQKASNGIASWFGLKKSKLPALSRKPEASKLKIGTPSAGKEAKTAAKKKLEAESLNISKLMEKAEDLRRALEEERVYMNGVALDRPGRGHSCEVVMDQCQGQLSVMYRGVSSDNFMQQLLNRVDERDPGHFGIASRRLSFDSKKSRPIFSHQRSDISHTKSSGEIEKGSDLISKDVQSDEILAESINSQHFTGSGSSMRTLDSGIGTFPLPDYISGAALKSVPKVKSQGEQEIFGPPGKLGLVTKVPRKAHTLERELSSLEEVDSCSLYSSALEGKSSVVHLSGTIHEDADDYGADVQSPPMKNWTVPNLKAPTVPAEVYLGVKEEMDPAGQTPFRRAMKACPPTPRDTDPASLPLPPPVCLARRGKSQTPIAAEMSKDGGLELIKEQPDDILSPSRPQTLETPESLSDSLYDSLSSCGSQG
ncbi:nck-associated protein 5-like [Brienomyrus brachyistius]|uniref:nck-associated protein 5-like n=1 Tax=Brienomyrus brachyistius TaxID=42636 RepID=UPI0020B2D9DF|nr:nck-associated protein 5-like [Brienomyrus brachyistius]XP_048856109.1 nck-associated protein 5-like [Brienomyrus brachyistius]XP_048856111.1 nck-associated protein 5-like [Brienomyrus brachyistius]